MSQTRSLSQRILSVINSVVTADLKKQVGEYQRKVTRILTTLVVGLTLFVIGLWYLTSSLATYLEVMFGLFATGLFGVILILVGIIMLMMVRPR